ncbi:uncharacterized protein [Henckelia pumila]|uniref:uncharacterized protein n=1 Tax=Henckelia pumila TaxID=405737 RepID=UPI003C6DE5EE
MVKNVKITGNCIFHLIFGHFHIFDHRRLKFVSYDISLNSHFREDPTVKIQGDTIKEGNKTSLQDRAKALIFLRHHLNDGLKAEYLTVKEPQDLWTNMKKIDLTIRERSMLTLCGEKVNDQDMLENTFSTFHASNVLLRQQYRECGFKKYSELISCLLVAEQNNELLMKNHQLHPTGSVPFPESNKVAFPEANVNSTRNNEQGRARGRGHGQRKDYQQQNRKKHKTSHQQWNSDYGKTNEKSSNKHEDKCYKCGVEGNWSRTCRMEKHLVDLYQNSIKEKEKIETNFLDNDDPVNITHLDVSDFFARPDRNIDHLVGGGVLEDIE